MSEASEIVARSVLIGAGATALLDLFNLSQKWAFKAQTPNWALVGRWIGYFPRGQFVHVSISKAEPIAGERAIGWLAHYAIGIGFAAITLAIFGLQWARHPALAPAMIVGLASVAAPFLIMQPGMGLGFAASKTPSPNQARLRSVISHFVFGFALYLAALAVAALMLG